MICCNDIAFNWEPDGDGQALICTSCGARWSPGSDGYEDVVNLRLAWKLLREKVETKTSWGKNALRDLMLDCLLESQ